MTACGGTRKDVVSAMVIQHEDKNIFDQCVKEQQWAPLQKAEGGIGAAS